MITLLKTYRPALYAFLLLIPTFYGMRAEYFLLFIAAVFVGESDLLKKILKEFFQNPLSKKNLPLLLAGLIVVLSLINKVLNGHLILCKTDYYAAFYLFPFLILSSILVNDKRFFNFLLIFTTIECLFGILEYLTGVRSIFLGSNSSNQIVDYSLLYNSRVYGLSANSSIFAYKILLAFILVDFSKIKGPFLWTLRILLLIGLMISFSRTVVIVLLFYWFIQLLVFLYRKRRTVFNYDPFRFSFLIVVIALVLFVPLRYQLSRGDKQAESVYKPLTVENRKAITCSEIHALTIKQGEKDPEKMGWGDKMMKASENIESSGRKLIWLNYMNYIEDHLWFGNGSDKLMFKTWNYVTGSYKLVHAHNSFIQLLANNGILISLMYLIFYVSFIRSKNWLPILVIVFYSMFNYGIFWGFSYMDLVFLMLLGSQFKPSYDDQGES